MRLNVIPAVDVLDRKCVQLIGGDRRKKRVEMGDPLAVAKDFVARGARYLHVIDLDRALESGDNADQVEGIIRETRVPVQVGGGLRSHEAIDRFVDAGADRVIVGTRAVLDTDWLRKMVLGHPGKVVVAVDTRGEEILIKGWKADSGKNLFEYARAVDALDLAGFLFTNVVLEGRMVGTDIKIVGRLVEAVRRPVMAAGGITTLRDLRELAGVGVSGAVVGSAIYEGKLELEKALEEFK